MSESNSKWKTILERFWFIGNFLHEAFYLFRLGDRLYLIFLWFQYRKFLWIFGFSFLVNLLIPLNEGSNVIVMKLIANRLHVNWFFRSSSNDFLQTVQIINNVVLNLGEILIILYDDLNCLLIGLVLIPVNQIFIKIVFDKIPNHIVLRFIDTCYFYSAYLNLYLG